MEQTTIHQEQLADLGNHPGFHLLLTLFSEEEGALLNSIQCAVQPLDVMRLTRTWQVLRSVHQALESAPENAAASLARLREEAVERFGLDETWLSRTGNGS